MFSTILKRETTLGSYCLYKKKNGYKTDDENCSVASRFPAKVIPAPLNSLFNDSHSLYRPCNGFLLRFK